MRSMTGFGKAATQDEQYELTVELRSVNNRYLEIAIRLPREFNLFEQKIRSILKKNILRGKLNVFISLNRADSSVDQPALDPQLAERLYSELHQLTEKLKFKATPSIQDLLQYYAMSDASAIKMDDDHFLSLLLPAVEQASEQLNKMREKEGAHLSDDIIKRLGAIEQLSKTISEQARLNIQETFDKMVQNIEKLIGAQKIDAARMEQEIALISDKVDITEEYVRMSSHINLFRQTISKTGEVGKKLTFILQEMLREANTMNSKSTQIEVQHHVIQMKEEIEKIREQVQNIE